MKHKFSLVLILFFLWTMVWGLWTLSYAEVPHLINYQGRLTDKDGKPVADGAYQITFRIYDAATAGNLLWEETNPNVLIQKGIFSVLLGSVTNLNLAFDKPYFLEIKTGDEVMTPRQQITSAGYAIRAEKAEKSEVANALSDVLSVPQGGTGRTAILAAGQAVGTTDVVLPTSEDDAPDMSVTLTTKGTKLLCMFSAIFYGTGRPEGDAYAYVKLFIDNVEVTKEKLTVSSYDSAFPNCSLQWLGIGYTPGSHTVKIKWYRGGAGVNPPAQRGATDSPRRLTVLDLD